MKIIGHIGSKQVTSFEEFNKRLVMRAAARPKTGSDYAVIGTDTVLASIQRVAAERGLHINQVQLSATGRSSTRHVMRVRFGGERGDIGINQYYPELVIFNSYNGEQSLKIETGIFRLICSNGLTIATDRNNHATVRHVIGPKVTEFTKQLDYQIAAAIDSVLAIDTRIQSLTDRSVTPAQETAIVDGMGLSKKTRGRLELIRGGHYGRDHEPNLWALYNAVNEALRLGSRSTAANEFKNQTLLAQMETAYADVA